MQLFQAVVAVFGLVERGQGCVVKAFGRGFVNAGNQRTAFYVLPVFDVNVCQSATQREGKRQFHLALNVAHIVAECAVVNVSNDCNFNRNGRVEMLYFRFFFVATSR